MPCTQCRLRYPDELVTEMFVTSGGRSERISVCGICALAIANMVHGVTRKRFDGEEAERLRQGALAWRRRNNRRPASR